MNKFIAIFSAKTESRLEHIYSEAEAILQVSSPKYLHILPHIVLFWFDGDIQGAASLFSVEKLSHDQVMVMQLEGNWRGRSLETQAHGLQDFFRPPTPKE